jgi:hypothetical protein
MRFAADLIRLVESGGAINALIAPLNELTTTVFLLLVEQKPKAENTIKHKPIFVWRHLQ